MKQVTPVLLLLLLLVSGCGIKKEGNNTLSTTVHTSCGNFQYQVTLYENVGKELAVGVTAEPGISQAVECISYSIPGIASTKTQAPGTTGFLWGNVPADYNLDQLEKDLRRSRFCVEKEINGEKARETVSLAAAVIKKSYVPPAVVLKKQAPRYKEAVPEDFNFLFKYGVGAKNVLNTFEGTFTKDLVEAGTETTGLEFSRKKMAAIYTKMRQIGLFDYPEHFNPESDTWITPYSTYYFKIKSGGEIKEIRWEDRYITSNKKAGQLQKLVHQIIQAIEQTEAYKKLPPAEGGYL